MEDNSKGETKMGESKAERTLERSAAEQRERAELNARIEANLPLVKHVVFQVAVHFPRHVDRDELARAGALGLVEAAAATTRAEVFRSNASQPSGSGAPSWTRSGPPTGHPRSVRLLARRLESTEQQLASELGRVPNVG